jgi:1-acyl-sn-glycerol-3-phosphate acyltransferase
MITLPVEPVPSLAILQDGLAALRDKARVAVRPRELAARDADFIERVRPLVTFFSDHYFRAEHELEEELPEGPFLAVGNHNGMTIAPDMFCLMGAFWRRYGVSRPSFGLMHDMPFHVPFAGAWLNASGAVRASPETAHEAIARGAAVLVFPGGDHDSCKSYWDRYRIVFRDRRGFVRTALREQVPIVPFVSVGAHSSLFIATSGERIASLLGLPKRFRSNVAPLGFALPLGFIFGVPYPHIPPPVKIHTRMLRAIRPGLPPEAADDPAAVESVFQEVRGHMEAAMRELRAAGRHGLFPRA